MFERLTIGLRARRARSQPQTQEPSWAARRVAGAQPGVKRRDPGTDEDVPRSPEEIDHVRAAMAKWRPLDISDDVAADIDAWERKLNQHGIDRADEGGEDAPR